MKKVEKKGIDWYKILGEEPPPELAAKELLQVEKDEDAHTRAFVRSTPVRTAFEKDYALNEDLTYWEAYLDKSDQDVKPANRTMKWDVKPFIHDSDVFFESYKDDIVGDLFDGIKSGVNTIYFKRAIVRKCKKALGFHREELPGMAERFDNLPMKRHIREECVYSNGQIRIPQLIKGRGACSIQSHLRIENISKFAGTTLQEAEKVAECYRIIGVSFKLALKINKLIRNRKQGITPCEIKLSKNGLTLIQLAEALREVDTPGVESHTNDKIDQIKHDNKYISLESLKEAWSWGDTDPELGMDNIAVYWNKDDDPVKDAQEAMYQQVNTVGEYTYWNQSVIPKFGECRGRRRHSFRKIITYIKDNKSTISKKKLKEISKWINKRCTWSQKAKFKLILSKYIPVHDPHGLTHNL